MSSGVQRFKVGDVYENSMLMTPEVMSKFREISNDASAIHHDAEYARSVGYNGPIVYGNLLGALISRLVGMKLPSRDVVIVQESIEFRQPAYVGDLVRLEATVASLHEAVGVVKMKLQFFSPLGPIATGKCDIKCL